MQEKCLLSITEASSLFGIGQHRLREIIREDYDDMRMVNHMSKEINGKLVFTDVVVHIEHDDLEHPEKEQDCCATCKSKFYPECMETCGLLERG